MAAAELGRGWTCWVERGMPMHIAPMAIHPGGEVLAARRAAAQVGLSKPLVPDAHGRRLRVEWDPVAPVTLLGKQEGIFARFPGG